MIVNLGLIVAYYSKFLSHLSTVMTPISNLVGKTAPRNINWTGECDKALFSVKKAISAPPILKIADLDAQFFVQVDASGTGIGAAMLQEVDNILHPCLFISRTLWDIVTKKKQKNVVIQFFITTFFLPEGGCCTAGAFLLCCTTGAFLLCLHAQHEFNRKCGVGGFPFRCRQVRHMFIFLLHFCVSLASRKSYFSDREDICEKTTCHVGFIINY